MTALLGLDAATRLALVAAVGTGSVEGSAIWTMWKLHEVVFGFNGARHSRRPSPRSVSRPRVSASCPVHFGSSPPSARHSAARLRSADPADSGWPLAGLVVGGLGFLAWVIFALTLAANMLRNRT